MIIGAAAVHLLSRAMQDLPAAYAVFTGIGVIGAISLGIVVHRDPVSIGRFTALALITGGIMLARSPIPTDHSASPHFGPPVDNAISIEDHAYLCLPEPPTARRSPRATATARSPPPRPLTAGPGGAGYATNGPERWSVACCSRWC
ncbi:hypothetical protein KBX63_08620 [Micromonospora sp. U21]|nr:hypothetical protein [Micromonospora sp. U21]